MTTTSEPGRKAERRALWLVGIVSAALGLATAAIWHAAASHYRRVCIGVDDGDVGQPGDCGTGALVWGPVVIVGAMAGIGLLTWILLHSARIRPRAAVLTSAFVSPALLVVLFASLHGLGTARIFVVGAAFTLLQVLSGALTRIRRVSAAQ